MQCHTYVTGRVLGPRIEQLNGVTYYPATGRWANQLDTLRSLGLINQVVPIDPGQPLGGSNASVVPLAPAASLPAYPEITSAAPPREIVGAYLASNCSHCHQPGGGGRGTFDFRAAHFLSACNAVPQAGVYDDPNITIVSPGNPTESMIYRRMTETALPYPMHPFRVGVDAAGAALVKGWIQNDAPTDCP
jgi:hypothetical protein